MKGTRLTENFTHLVQYCLQSVNYLDKFPKVGKLKHKFSFLSSGHKILIYFYEKNKPDIKQIGEKYL